LSIHDSPPPIDDSDGGRDKFYKAWTREDPGLNIAPGDVASDSGEKIYRFGSLQSLSVS
jgi:hypothetical protein